MTRRSYDDGSSSVDRPTTEKAGDDAVRILVIDDDPITLDILEAVLGEAGFQVATHNTPFGSAQIMRRHLPDVVLVDVEMPALKGDTIITNLRRNLAPGDACANAEFILYSGTRASELETLTKRTGALGSIEKDGNFDGFLTKLTRIMQRAPRLAAKLPQR